MVLSFLGLVLPSREDLRISRFFKTRDFLRRYAHNVSVMSYDDNLFAWYRNKLRDPEEGDLSRVTLGQLQILLELHGKQSIAESTPEGKSEEVNRRQKLSRLEAGLAIGGLTKLVGNRSQLSETGKRIAAEFRMFIEAVQCIEGSSPRLIHVAAGDTWAQSILIPSVWELRDDFPDFRWKVSNMEPDRIVADIRDGRIHFGLIRRSFRKESNTPSFGVVDGWEISALTLLVGSAVPKTKAKHGREVLGELAANRIPWIQHEGTWRGIAKSISSTGGEPSGLKPDIECGTHLQAAMSVLSRRAWCIVPSQVTHVLRLSALEEPTYPPPFRSYDLSGFGEKDVLELICNPRVVSRSKGLTRAESKMRAALRKAMAAKYPRR